MFEYDKTKLGNLLIGTGIAYFCIFLFGLAILSFGPRFEGDIANHLALIEKDPAMYKLGYLFAGFTAPATFFVLFLLNYYVRTKISTPVLTRFSMLMLVPFVLLESIAYFSQSAYLPKLISADSQYSIEWYFGNHASLCYFLQQLGYFIFAVSGILSGYRFCFDAGVKRAFGIYLEIRCLISFVAFFALVFDSRINDITILSGVMTMFFGLFLVLIGNQEKRRAAR